ncbi:MAG: hypothetical protein WDM86_07090 [Rhizomicrobium sp.]
MSPATCVAGEQTLTFAAKKSHGPSTFSLEPAMPSEPFRDPPLRGADSGKSTRPIPPPSETRLLAKPKSAGRATAAMAIGAAILFVLAVAVAGPFHSEKLIPPAVREKLLLVIFVLCAIEVIYGFAMYRKNSST